MRRTEQPVSDSTQLNMTDSSNQNVMFNHYSHIQNYWFSKNSCLLSIPIILYNVLTVNFLLHFWHFISSSNFSLTPILKILFLFHKEHFYFKVNINIYFLRLSSYYKISLKWWYKHLQNVKRSKYNPVSVNNSRV